MFVCLSIQATSNIGRMYFNNGFIITWILQQIIIHSNKVKHKAGKNNGSLHPPPLPPPLLLDERTDKYMMSMLDF